MFDEDKLHDQIIDSLSDSKVPNNPGKIKALYLDRTKGIGRPWYKYRRFYAIGMPVLAAVTAIAIVVPITIHATKNGIDKLNSQNQKYITEYTNIKGSNNQIAFATLFLGNAARTLENTSTLPSETISNSTFVTIKNLKILNSYSYSIERLLTNEFNPSYYTQLNSEDDSLSDLYLTDSTVYSTYSYVSKSSFDGEENFTLDGTIKYTDGSEEYAIKGSKNSAFGSYNCKISMYLDAEKTYGFSVVFKQTILDDKSISVEEFRNNKVLSSADIVLESRIYSDSTQYSVNATLDDMEFSMSKLPNGNLTININTNGRTSDTFLVTISDDGSKYHYINSEIGIDFPAKRK